MGIKNFSVRIDDEILKKLRVVAAHEGRSVNSEMLFLIQNAVEDYESKHDEKGGHEVMQRGILQRTVIRNFVMR